MIELYQAIRMNPVEFDSECNEELKDLLLRLLEKDPKKRINIEQLRVCCQDTHQMLPLTWPGTPLGHTEWG